MVASYVVIVVVVVVVVVVQSVLKVSVRLVL
jgi:hypothetical protein